MEMRRESVGVKGAMVQESWSFKVPGGKKEKKYLFSECCREFTSWHKNYVNGEKTGDGCDQWFVSSLVIEHHHPFDENSRTRQNQCPSYNGMTRGSHALLITPSLLFEILNCLYCTRHHIERLTVNNHRWHAIPKFCRGYSSSCLEHM